MTQEMIIQLASSAVWTLLKVSAPLITRLARRRSARQYFAGDDTDSGTDAIVRSEDRCRIFSTRFFRTMDHAGITDFYD